VAAAGTWLLVTPGETRAGATGPDSSSPPVQPRAAWGGDLPPLGPLEAEADGDVRFLLVHHTAGPNDYGADEVPEILRGIYRFHTGPDKGWPDVAYNFFVDRYGGVWEGRTGSLTSPVKGDATGGSQGFALLCCFLGTHTDTPPTAEAQGAMVGLLAWLADTYGIDTAPGATASFVSRGSSNHPAGTSVTTPTISGHRDMSATTCPGDAAYALVTGSFPAAVTAAKAAAPVPSAEVDQPVTTAPPAAPSTAAPTVGGSAALDGAGPTTEPSAGTVPDGAGDAERAAPTADDSGRIPVVPLVAVGVAAVAAVVVGWRRRARPTLEADDPGEDQPQPAG
jgi:hypothetical protein